MLMGKTVGLIGFGQIAQAVAERIAGWGCRIVTTVRTPRPLPPGVTAVPLDELLRDSDVVVVLVPLNADSAGMLDAARLRTMKPEVAFINVARGGIVEDDALAALARERPEMRLALDVFAQEPLPTDSPLRALPNAILTPRMVGHTRETLGRLPLVVTENVERAIAGTAPAYVRNPEILEAWLARWRAPAPAGA
jgi:D-3-phosphoglycerate dehydrogenase